MRKKEESVVREVRFGESEVKTRVYNSLKLITFTTSKVFAPVTGSTGILKVICAVQCLTDQTLSLVLKLKIS